MAAVPDFDPLLTKAEAGLRAGGISIATVERHIRAGRLCALKLGHLTRIRESDLIAFLAALPAAEYRPSPGRKLPHHAVPTEK